MTTPPLCVYERATGMHGTTRSRFWTGCPARVVQTFFVVTLVGFLLTAVAPSSFRVQAAAQDSEASDAEIDIELLSQSVQPSTPLLVRITVRAERAISGQLELVPGENEWGDPNGVDSEYRWDIDIAANTEVQTLALMPVSWDTNAVEARLTADGAEIAKQKKSFNVGMMEDREQIGTFGVESPARVGVVGATGDASVTKLDGFDLFGPALESFSTIVADPTALANLDTNQRAVVAAWVMDGGQLSLPNGVDDLGPAGLGELDALRSGPIVGQGVVVARDADALSDDVILANGTAANAEMFGPTIWSDPVASLGQRSGLQLASVRSLAIFLAVYAVVAGPLAYAVAQRIRRPRLLWIILPTTALAFTGVAALTGSVVRSAGHDEHTTVVMSRPSGSQAESYLLVRGGEEIAVDGNWWVSATQSDMVQQGPGSLRFTVGAETTTASVQVPSGSAALLTATGPDLDGDAGLQLAVDTNDAKTLTGTVTNNLAVDLHDAIVIWGAGSVDIDTIAAGETKPFSLEYKERVTNQWGEPLPGPEQTKWGMVNVSQNGMGGGVVMAEEAFGDVAMNVAVADGPVGGVGEPPEGTIADGNIWTLWRANHVAMFSPLQIVAIGWTDELPSPTASIATGRTAFVSTIATKAADAPAFRMVNITSTNEMFMEQDGNAGGPPVFQIRQRVDFAEPIVAKDWSVRLERRAAGLAFDVDGEKRWVHFEADDDGEITVSVPEELDGATSAFITTSFSAEGPMGSGDGGSALVYRDPEALVRKLDPGDKPVYRDVPFMGPQGVGRAQAVSEPITVPPLTVDAPYVVSGVVEEPGVANLYVIELNKNADVTVDMVSSEGGMDPMLTLRDSEGTSVASNDDVRGSTNSSLNFAGADPGRYEILAESIGAPGTYELTITLNDAGDESDPAEGEPPSTGQESTEPASTEPGSESMETPTPLPVPTESVDG